jgi:hypothetical protein
MSHEDPVQAEAPATGSGASDTNGFHAPPGDGNPEAAPGASAETANQPNHVDRAEQMVERVATNVSSFTAKWGRRAWSVVSRVREEAEDLWSEVQSIRRGDQR